MNNEIGLPLAILGDYEKTGGPFFWARVFLRAVLQIIFKAPYPRILVLEYAADKPGDIGYLVRIARPDIAVVGAVGDVPVHVEFYKDREEVLAEKSKLVRALPEGGIALLDFDEPEVLNMRAETKARVMTFGFKEGADLRITNFENRSEFGIPIGVSFKLESQGSYVPVKIENVFGRGQALALAAAACVGLLKDINLVKISESLALYPGNPGRSRLISGIKDSYIIDDTYNASPLSVASALEVLRDLNAPRKIAVLGDMAELGKYSTYAHEEVGKMLPRTADVLVTVGAKARFIAEGARQSGFPNKDIYEFDDSDEAKVQVQNLIHSNDVILVKGSQSARMEKIVLEIMANPQDAGKLLVRQYGKWLK